MLPKPESACLLIADISGYTGYLAGVELDHAQDILADLMDTIVDALRPPFRLSKLEGDAAFVYLASSDLDGSLLQDIVEATYFTFRRRLRDIKQASVCECDACRQIPSLDLKFVAHFGQIAKQAMSGQEELIGRDVILIHRLLKNNVEAVLGERPYVLYTDALTQRAGIDPQAQGLIAHRESIDIIGEVRCWLRDLDAAWKAEQERSRMEVSPSDGCDRDFHDRCCSRAADDVGISDNARTPRHMDGRLHRGRGKCRERSSRPRHDHALHAWEGCHRRRVHRLAAARLHHPAGADLRYRACHDNDARIERWPRWGDAHRHPGRQACGGGHGKFIALTPLLEQSMRASGEMLVKQLDEAAARQRAAAGAEPALPASAGRFVRQPVSH
jgi:hypothetical protein